MDLERRRLLLALASTTAYLIAQALREIAFSIGYVATNMWLGHPLWRVVAVAVPILLAALILRDLQRQRSDWPLERLVIALSAGLGIVMATSLASRGPPSTAIAWAVFVAEAAAVLLGLLIRFGAKRDGS